jgi:hypothetical protein
VVLVVQCFSQWAAALADRAVVEVLAAVVSVDLVEEALVVAVQVEGGKKWLTRFAGLMVLNASNLLNALNKLNI